MAITATVTAGTEPPSVTLVASGGTGVIERLEGTVATPVRGTDPLWAGGTILDYEVPQEVSVTYRFAGAVSPAVQMPNVGVWFIPAGRPELAAQMTVATHESWTTAANSDTARIPGRPNPIVVTWGPRGGDAGTFTATVYTREEELDLKAALAIQGTILLSCPADIGLGGWMNIGDVQWGRRINYCGEPSRSVNLPYVMQDRPEVLTVDAGHRIIDLVGPISGLVGTIGNL